MWKLQKAFTTATKKERSRESLPQPPKGMAWWQNQETREWKLVPEDDDLLLQNEKKEKTAVENSNDESPLTASTNTLPSSNQHGQKKKEDPTPTPTATATAGEVETVEFESDATTTQKADVFANPFDIPTSSNTQHVLLNLPEDHVINNAKDTNDNIHTMLHRFNVSGEESKSQHEVGSDDWELLSDKLSGSTSNGNSKSSGIAFVSRNGSISSHNTSTSLFSYGKLPSCHHTKLERCPSNSTIDSHDADAVLGPSGKGVLGVDYVEHVILPSDTIQGICLAYKLSASRLKRANHFSGDSLAQAPKKLVIPISKAALQQGYLRVQDTDTKEYMLHALQAEFPQISATEAKAYLELANWKLQDAIRSAKEDHEWDNTPNTGNQSNLRSGQIRVMMGIRANNDHEGVQLDFSAQGAGYSSAVSPSRNNNNKSNNNKPVSTEAVNSTSVKLEDIPQVASQHNSVGVELQSLSLRK